MQYTKLGNSDLTVSRICAAGGIRQAVGTGRTGHSAAGYRRADRGCRTGRAGQRCTTAAVRAATPESFKKSGRFMEIYSFPHKTERP